MRAAITLGTVALLLAFSGTAAGAADTSFTSPAGEYRVVLRQVAHETFSKEESLAALDNVDHVTYEVRFVRLRDEKVVAKAEYTDVYGFDPGQAPTPPSVLARRFDWSPREDFAVLPVEGWASAPGTPEAQAVALSDDLPWSTAEFSLDHVTWADSLMAVGDRHGDCDYWVDTFDGRTGRQEPLPLPGESPLGYRIDSVHGRIVKIRTMLDNCSSEEMRRRFRPVCHELDLDGMQLREVTCPEAFGAG